MYIVIKDNSLPYKIEQYITEKILIKGNFITPTTSEINSLISSIYNKYDYVVNNSIIHSIFNAYTRNKIITNYNLLNKNREYIKNLYETI